MSTTELIEAAAKARTKAYAPYSKFFVGAALLTRSGKIFTGCNVENVSLGLTICAERNALAAAIAGGEREISTIAIVSDCNQPVFPCGACRQVLAEFNPELEIVTSTIEGRSETALLSSLLPRPGKRIQDHIRNV